MGRDYLSVEVWDLNTERRPVETHQARPWAPPPRPSCASIRSTSTFEASCVPSATMMASLTTPSAAGMALTGSKWVRKQRRQLAASTAHLAGTADKYTAQWGFKEMCTGGESLGVRGGGRPSEVDSKQLRAITQADPLKPHKQLPQNSVLTILRSFGI